MDLCTGCFFYIQTVVSSVRLDFRVFVLVCKLRSILAQIVPMRRRSIGVGRKICFFLAKGLGLRKDPVIVRLISMILCTNLIVLHRFVVPVTKFFELFLNR